MRDPIDIKRVIHKMWPDKYRVNARIAVKSYVRHMPDIDKEIRAMLSHGIAAALVERLKTGGFFERIIPDHDRVNCKYCKEEEYSYGPRAVDWRDDIFYHGEVYAFTKDELRDFLLAVLGEAGK